MGPIHPVSPSGNSYILTITDYFTKWVDCIPLPDTTVLTTAKALIKAVYYRHGAPKCILSDRGTSFTALIFRSLCKDLGIRQKFSTAFHSQNAGQVERANGSFMSMVRHYVNEAHENWENVLEPLQFAYCNSVHSSTWETPYFLVHGRDPNLLIDIIFDYAKNKPLITPMDFKSQLLDKLSIAFELVRENTKLPRQQYKIQYDKRAKELDYKPGDRVLLDIKTVPKGHSRKLLPKYEGPFRIVRVFDKGVVTIIANGVEKKVNVCRLKPLSPGMIWRDEYCEPYEESSTDRPPRTRDQVTSTRDDKQKTEEATKGDGQETEDLPHSDNNVEISEMDVNLEVECEQTHVHNTLHSQPVAKRSDSVNSPELDSHADLPVLPNSNTPTRNLRPRRARQAPSRFQDYYVDFKE